MLSPPLVTHSPRHLFLAGLSAEGKNTVYIRNVTIDDNIITGFLNHYEYQYNFLTPYVSVDDRSLIIKPPPPPSLPHQ